MPLSRLTVLDNTLRAAGIPIAGISNNGPPYPAGIVIQYTASATAEQIAAGNQIAETFDYRARQSLTRSQIVTGYQGLTTTQRNTLLAHLLTILLRQNAAEVDALLTETGVPLAVDEVVPT